MTALSTLFRVQFRPGPVFGDRLRRRATQWTVTENEAARRLSALADCGLSIGDHDQVVEIYAHDGERAVVSAIRAAGYVPGQRGEWIRKDGKK